MTRRIRRAKTTVKLMPEYSDNCPYPVMAKIALKIPESRS